MSIRQRADQSINFYRGLPLDQEATQDIRFSAPRTRLTLYLGLGLVRHRHKSGLIGFNVVRPEMSSSTKIHCLGEIALAQMTKPDQAY
eukprot:6172300-Pleurochrysis_carterae.AAC.6